jgi:hypothetical protein
MNATIRAAKKRRMRTGGEESWQMTPWTEIE